MILGFGQVFVLGLYLREFRVTFEKNSSPLVTQTKKSQLGLSDRQGVANVFFEQGATTVSKPRRKK